MCTYLHGREKSIKNTLASEKGVVAGKLLRHGAGFTHGPVLAHGETLLDAIGRLNLDDVLSSTYMFPRQLTPSTTQI